jgi:hypothetical protein
VFDNVVIFVFGCFLNVFHLKKASDYCILIFFDDFDVLISKIKKYKKYFDVFFK